MPINIKYTALFYLTFMILILLTSSCKDNSTGPSDKEFVLPDSNLSFDKDIGPLFLAKCASGSGCHSSTSNPSGLDLTDYQQIQLHWVDTDAGPVKLVEPGSGNTSFLYRILLSGYLGRIQMPKDGPYLNQNNTNGVKVWIDEGALY